LTEQNNVGTNLTVILDGIQSGTVEIGGKLAFSADGMLYVSVGFNANDSDPDIAQDPTNLNGKILRIRKDGTVPPDNPFPNSPIWALGLRNVFGLAVDQKTGFLWASNNGPECDDTINRIQKGQNFGWRAEYVCGESEPQFAPPNFRWSNPIGVTALAFACESVFPQLKNQVLVGAFNDARVRTLRFSTDARDRLALEETLLDLPGDEGVIDILNAPNGEIYITTISAIYRLKANVAATGGSTPSNLALRFFIPGAWHGGGSTVACT
jgi:glucose/arabinose dehydrogenase